jgi:hypothetical protein
MSNTESPATVCAVCGKDIINLPGVSHLFHEGRSFSLCCPVCIQMFQRAPARFASGERPASIVDELISELKWAPKT